MLSIDARPRWRGARLARLAAGAFGAAVLASPCGAHPAPAPTSMPTDGASGAVEPDSSAACEAAELLALERLAAAWCRGAVGGGAAEPIPADHRTEAVATIVRAGFDVDAFVSAIQAETAALQELESYSEAARDRRVTLLSGAAGVLGIGAAAGTAMTLESRTTTAGIWVSTVAGAVGGVLSIVAAVLPSAARSPIRIDWSMLRPLLEPGASPPYPRLVDEYLARRAPHGHGLSRRDLLLGEWARLGLVADFRAASASARGLVAPVAVGELLDSDVVATRRMMLGDLRGLMAGLKRDLAALADLVARS